MLNSPVEYAANVLNKIASNIPEIERLRTTVIEGARKHGYVESLGGHRSYIHGIKSFNSAERAGAERSAFDSLFQGTASGDITKIATNTIQELLDKIYPDKFNPGIKLVQQIHDEVLLEGDESELKAISADIVGAFEQAMTLKVPLIAEYEIGKSWGDIH
jgi:DNA polymerase-1